MSERVCYCDAAFHRVIWLTSQASHPLASGSSGVLLTGVDHMPDEKNLHLSDEQTLRDKARSVVQQGKLPARAPDRVWGGPGVGAPCEVCGVPVTKAEKEFQIEFE